MNRTSLRLAALLLATPLLTGCFSSAPAATIHPAATTSPALPSQVPYAMGCPPGVRHASGGACVGTIASVTESSAEPFLAISPTNPDVMAVGVNAGHTTDALVTQGRPGLQDLKFDVYFTQDAGKTWRRESLPPLPQAHPVPVD